MKEFFLIYFIVINIISIFLTIVDKRNAIKKHYRVSEKRLILFSILGGSVSMYITMKIIRHKTKHKKFMIGIPIIFILQIALSIFLIFNFLI